MLLFLTTVFLISALKVADGVELTVSGVLPPVFTPINEDGSLNLDMIPVYAKFLNDSSINNVLILGTNGLQVWQRKLVIDAWMDVRETYGLQVVAQVGTGPMTDVLEVARYSAEKGVDAIMTLPDCYYKPYTPAQLVDYVGLVAAAAPNVSVLYHHKPDSSGVHKVRMPDFVKLATEKIPNFKGLKYSSPNLLEADQTFRALQPGQQLFFAVDQLTLSAAVLGITSNICHYVFASLTKAVLDAVAAKDLDTAQELQLKLTLVSEATDAEGIEEIPTVKAAMHIAHGLDMGPPLLPQRRISYEKYQALKKKLNDLGYGTC